MSLIRAASLFIVLVLLSVSAVQGQEVFGVTCFPWICAAKGSTVEMSCTIVSPEGINQEVNTQETFWFKHSEYDVKENSQYSGRVQSTCVKNNCTLTITDVTETDGGDYRLMMKRNMSRYLERAEVLLEVRDLEVQVRRHDETGLIFTCEHTCSGDPSYIWFKNGEEIKHETSRDYSSNQVLHTDSYSCAVRGQEKFPSPPVSVQGQEVFEVTCSPSWICAYEGSTVEMSCTIIIPEGINQEVHTQETFWSSKRPEYDVDVKEDSQYSGRVQSTCVRNNCTLTITDVTETDGGDYRLMMKRNMSRYSERAEVYLVVTDLEIQVERHDEAGLIFMCEDRCSDDRSYIWFKNGEEIKHETSRDYSLNQILHTDSYSCALRGQEKFPSPPVYAPKLPSVSLSSHGEIKEGSSVNLTCSSDANPAANYTWYKVDGPLNPHHTSSGATLVFSSIQSSDFGEFYCEAENTLGRRTSKHISVNLPWISDSVKTILR